MAQEARMQEELKRCPYHPKRKTVYDCVDGKYHYVFCPDKECPSLTYSHNTKDEAFEAWDEYITHLTQALDKQCP